MFIECIVRGVGFHNAGLDYADRKSVEELFLNGDLLVLGETPLLHPFILSNVLHVTF